ncbi:MAG: hypothetical protein K2L24_03405 [Opitutales bacterium]|nr:hypothetical protein [Opitutales bacterium]
MNISSIGTSIVNWFKSLPSKFCSLFRKGKGSVQISNAQSKDPNVHNGTLGNVGLSDAQHFEKSVNRTRQAPMSFEAWCGLCTTERENIRAQFRTDAKLSQTIKQFVASEAFIDDTEVGKAACYKFAKEIFAQVLGGMTQTALGAHDIALEVRQCIFQFVSEVDEAKTRNDFGPWPDDVERLRDAFTPEVAEEFTTHMEIIAQPEDNSPIWIPNTTDAGETAFPKINP